MTFPTKAQFIALMRKQIGVKENPLGSNRQPYGVWFGWNGVAWCAIWICWLLWQLGAKVTKCAGAHELGILLLKIPGVKKISASNVQSGDITIMTWSHIEACEARQSSSAVVNIGGNVANKVSRTPRANSSIAYGIRLPWADEAPSVPSTPTTPTVPSSIPGRKAITRQATQGWNMTLGTKRDKLAKGGIVFVLGSPVYNKNKDKFVLVSVGGRQCWVRYDHLKYV
jgi:hypothetical protein